MCVFDDRMPDDAMAWHLGCEIGLHTLEIRFGRVQSRDSSNTRNTFGRIAGCVRSQRVPNQMHIFWPEVVLLLQLFDQIGDFEANEAGVGGSLSLRTKFSREFSSV